MTTTYVQQLATARKAVLDTNKILTQAIESSTIDADLAALALRRDPAGWAKCLREIADIVDALPALRAAWKDALKTLSPLEAKACTRCNGTGQYNGPSSATRRGVAYCFGCDGRGHC